MELAVVILNLVGLVYFYNKSKKHPPIAGTYMPHWKQKYGDLSPDERRAEYRRKGKSPSGVIDGVYNDMYREDDRPYTDADRDWDADA